MKVVSGILRFARRLLSVPVVIAVRLVLLSQRVAFGRRVIIRGVPYVRNYGIVDLGDGVKINSGYRYNPIGGDMRTILICASKGVLVIGDETGLSNCTINTRARVIIGKRCLLGGGTKIYDHDFHPLNPVDRNPDDPAEVRAAPVEIGDDCFIGAHAIILKGVTIGSGSVIGAGSVVAGKVPAGEIWAGNPARRVGSVPASGSTTRNANE